MSLVNLSVLSLVSLAQLRGSKDGKDAALCTTHVGGAAWHWAGHQRSEGISRTFAIEVDGLSLAVAHRDSLDLEGDAELSLVAKHHAGFRD